MPTASTLGFIGLGVMGEPMCRNLARKSGCPVVAFDRRPEPLKALARDGVAVASSVAEVAQRAQIVFLSLPGEPEVRGVCLGEGGLAARVQAGRVVVDTSTLSGRAGARAGAGLRGPRRGVRRRASGPHRPGRT